MKKIESLGVYDLNKNCKLVRRSFKKGDVIPKHNHPEADVVFLLLQGSIDLKIGSDSLVIKQGDIVNFDGEDEISGKILEDSSFAVFLLK